MQCVGVTVYARTLVTCYQLLIESGTVHERLSKHMSWQFNCGLNQNSSQASVQTHAAMLDHANAIHIATSCLNQLIVPDLNSRGIADGFCRKPYNILVQREVPE